MLPLAILMSRDLKTIAHNATLKEAACMMRDKCIGSLLVVRDGENVGILSETDLVRRGLKATVERIMSSPIISIDIERTAEEANTIMSERAIRHLAVTDQGKIVGVLSVRDLLIYFKNQF